jgi:tetratricopeptide (TPR) repeat protein
MRVFQRIACLVCCCTLGGAFAAAEEPYIEFLSGLRERQYHDFAIVYLDQLATRPGLPAEFKQSIPFEKAITLMESARISRSPEKQTEQLDQALAFLDQFVKDSPNHPRSGDANSQRAEILIGKARVEILQSRAPANQGSRSEFQAKARALVAKARDVFQTAFTQHETAWKTYGTFIDRTKDEAKYDARAKSEVNMIRAQLDLALCTYEEAQTYDADAADFKRLLNEAAAKFEEMHQRYRSQVAGLFARLWQAKCFEEQGDLQKALGIYNELLAHPGEDGAISRLKDQTLQFKLISLNSKDRGDYQLVVDLGSEWLKKHAVEARTRTGLGIRWEVARAYESLGDKRDLPKNEAQRFWRESRDEAQQVNRYPSEFKDVSLALMQRLDVKLVGKERLPETFDAAFGLGRQMVTAIKETKDTLDAAERAKKPADELKKLEQELSGQLKEAADMLDRALRLVGKNDDQKSITLARFNYAYVNILMKRYYEAAILGEYVAKTVDKDDTTLGLDAAYLAMVAYIQAFNANKAPPGAERDADIRLIVHAANLIAGRWPQSDRANDARMTLGRLYSQTKRPVEAAEWYGKVPATDPKYAEAQLASGQAYWTAYLSLSRAAEAERPTPQQLADWQKLAQEQLRGGITKMSATVPKEGAAPPELIAAKMSLAQIIISQGQDADAIKLLLDEPQSVIKAITVADETKRPDKGVQGRAFATETYKLLLRAYIGGGKLNEARDTMKTLEAVVGAEGGADVTELYVSLGKLLRDELDRFKATGETDRFNKLMGSFENFLNDLYQRKEGQTFGSLSWIGETYFALGEATADDAARATGYYEKAGSAFQDIINRAGQAADFVRPEQLPAVRVRLVRCLRMKKDFTGAETLIGEVLKTAEKELRAQYEAALLYQDWGASGETKRLTEAINGNPKLLIWGWRGLSNRLQNSIDRGNAEYLQMFVDSRVNGTATRRTFALAQTSQEKRKAELEKCEIELIATATVTKGLSDEQFGQFNQLYRQVLEDAGKPVADLKISQEVTETVATTGDEPSTKPAATKKKAAAKLPPPKPIDNTLNYIVLGASGVLALGGIGWFLLKGKSKKKSLVPGPAVFTAPIGAVPTPKPRGAPVVGKSAGTATATPRTAAPRPAGTATASPKPKPKPKPPTA